jgi:CheY-like chemotaxis protein
LLFFTAAWNPGLYKNLVSPKTVLGMRMMGVVLIVEDDEQVRVLAESVIQEVGHQTLSAANVDEALAILNDLEKRVDLLFTDIQLGQEQGGIELARQAVEKRPELHVIYTTGRGVTDGMRALFVDDFIFLAKPYTVDGLTSVVTDLVGKPKPLTERSARPNPSVFPLSPPHRRALNYRIRISVDPCGRGSSAGIGQRIFSPDVIKTSHLYLDAQRSNRGILPSDDVRVAFHAPSEQKGLESSL